MPELVNCLPFSNLRFYSEDNRGLEFGVIVLKGTYEILPSGELFLAEEQAPLVFTDRYHGETSVSSLWHPSDLVPKKPTADIIVNAVAYAPNGQPVPSFTCGLKLSGPEGVLIDKQLRVTVPRSWAPQWRRELGGEERTEWKAHRNSGFRNWTLTTPEPVAEVPLRYEYAFGGTFTKGQNENGDVIYDCDTRNPIGRGFIDREWTDHSHIHPAPQIEDIRDPISEPYRVYAPESLGPISPAWEPRLPLAGTYDDEWQKTVWPKWPEYYNSAFNNSAHPSLIAQRYLERGDRIELINLLPDLPVCHLTIPHLRPIVQFLRHEGHIKRSDFVIDTCFIDASMKTASDVRVYLSWRLQFEPNIYNTAVLGVAPDDFPAEFEEMKRRAS